MTTEQYNKPNKSKIASCETTFEVDLTGIEPVPLPVKSSMLPLTLQAQVHKFIVQQKEPFFKDSVC